MNAKGFTLIEVILIIVLLAIAIPGLITAVSFMTTFQVTATATTTAMNLAQEELETVIAKKRSTCGTCGYANIPAGPGAFAAVPGFTEYQKKTAVEYVDSNLNSSGSDVGYKKITVTVQAVSTAPSVPDAVLVTVVTDY